MTDVSEWANMLKNIYFHKIIPYAHRRCGTLIELYLLSSHPFRVESSPKSRLRSDVSFVERNICTMLHLVGMQQNVPIDWLHPYGMRFCGFTSFSTELYIPSACVM